MFEKHECRRENSYYSYAGFLCRQTKEEMNCGDGVTLFGVNIGGGMHTDKRHIIYSADKDAVYEDTYNTKRDYDNIMNQILDDDKPLYGTCVVGVANGTDFGQCLRYVVEVTEDGSYELGLRLVEPEYAEIGKRVCI